ncbi:MAG: hypoxanthine phosphoribosyltransferase [Bacillota bacterium]|nr:hypoxanthine phosphoribosyltransferase [Bacillota bacterium]
MAELGRIILTEQQIQSRVRDLGNEITRDYKNTPFVAIGILKGAFLFLGDLAKQIDTEMCFDFMATSSYGRGTTTSGEVRIIKDLDDSIEGRHVLVVEDIIDTGLTLNYLLEVLRKRGPASLKVCCLLDKPSRRQVPVQIDYVGFEIPDVFVVGYGLDCAEVYRNLPYIASLKT